jgi:hypothetical protein
VFFAFFVRNPKLQCAMSEWTRDEFFKGSDALCIAKGSGKVGRRLPNWGALQQAAGVQASIVEGKTVHCSPLIGLSHPHAEACPYGRKQKLDVEFVF